MIFRKKHDSSCRVRCNIIATKTEVVYEAEANINKKSNKDTERD